MEYEVVMVILSVRETTTLLNGAIMTAKKTKKPTSAQKLLNGHSSKVKAASFIRNITCFMQRCELNGFFIVAKLANAALAETAQTERRG